MSEFKVGDKVKTLQKSYYGKYEIGSIGIISDVDFPCEDGLERIVVDYGNNQDGLYSKGDLELVERKKTKNQRIEELEKELYKLKEDYLKDQQEMTEAVKTLTKKVESLEFVLAEKSKITVTKRNPLLVDDGIKFTINQQRKEIIEKAKKFVEENSRKATSLVDAQVTVSFYVSKKNRMVTVLIRGLFTGKLFRKGVAKCYVNDVFNEDLGKAIVLGRALGLDVSEFENAIQPTQYAIGQIVQRHYESINTNRKYRVDRIGKGETLTKLFDGGSFGKYAICNTTLPLNYDANFTKSLKVVDDTNAEY